MSAPFLGEIRMFAGNFAPRNHASCNGQLMPIQQNTALFSLLGTLYGGNGTSTFALPDLRGRAPIHAGQGAGLSSYVVGQASGAETVTVSALQMPAHAHTLAGASATGSAASPSGAYFASAEGRPYSTSAVSGTDHAPAAVVGTSGGAQPHENMPPFLVITFIIALEGIFPARN